MCILKPGLFRLRLLGKGCDFLSGHGVLLLRLCQLLLGLCEFGLRILEDCQLLVEVGALGFQINEGFVELITPGGALGDASIQIREMVSSFLFCGSAVGLDLIQPLIGVRLAALEIFDGLLNAGTLLREGLHQGVLGHALLRECGDFILLGLTLLAKGDEKSLHTGSLLIHGMKCTGGVLQPRVGGGQVIKLAHDLRFLPAEGFKTLLMRLDDTFHLRDGALKFTLTLAEKLFTIGRK